MPKTAFGRRRVWALLQFAAALLTPLLLLIITHHAEAADAATSLKSLIQQRLQQPEDAELCAKLKVLLEQHPTLFRYSNLAQDDIEHYCQLNDTALDDLVYSAEEHNNLLQQHNDLLVSGNEHDDGALLAVQQGTSSAETSCDGPNSKFKLKKGSYYVLKDVDIDRFVSIREASGKDSFDFPVVWSREQKDIASHWRVNENGFLVNRKTGLKMTYRFSEEKGVSENVFVGTTGTAFEIRCESANSNRVTIINPQPHRNFRTGVPYFADEGLRNGLSKYNNMESPLSYKPQFERIQHETGCEHYSWKCSTWRSDAIEIRSRNVYRSCYKFVCEAWATDPYVWTAKPKVFEMSEVSLFIRRDIPKAITDYTVRNNQFDSLMDGLTGVLNSFTVAVKTFGGSVLFAFILKTVYNKPSVETQLDELAKQIMAQTKVLIVESAVQVQFKEGVNLLDQSRKEYATTYAANKYYAIVAPAEKQATEFSKVETYLDATARSHQQALAFFRPLLGTEAVITKENVRLFQTVFDHYMLGIAELLNMYQEKILLKVYLDNELNCRSLVRTVGLQDIVDTYRARFGNSTAMLVNARLKPIKVEYDILSEPECFSLACTFKYWPRWTLKDDEYAETLQISFNDVSRRSSFKAALEASISTVRNAVHEVRDIYENEIRFDMTNWSYDWTSLKTALDRSIEDTVELCRKLKSVEYREQMAWFTSKPEFIT